MATNDRDTDQEEEGSAAPRKCSFSLGEIGLACAIGIVLPIYAFAQAMNALFGFERRCVLRAAVLIAVPTAVYLVAALLQKDSGDLRRIETLGYIALYLGAQLVVAVLVALVVSKVFGRWPLR